MFAVETGLSTSSIALMGLSTVRAEADLENCFNLLNIASVGFDSGLYAGI